MKKFTKVLAAFCAMAMVFGTFSVTVFAGEEYLGSDPATEEAVPDSKEADEAAQEPAPAAEAEPDEAEPAEEPAKEEEKEDSAAMEPKQEEQDDVKSAPRSVSVKAVNGQETGSEPENNPEEPVPYVPFADGYINQTDINCNGGKMPETSGTYTLAQDITVSAGAEVFSSDQQITIDLNGYTITYSGDGTADSFYHLGRSYMSGSSVMNYSGNVLTIRDSSSAQTGLIKNGAGYIGGGSTNYWSNGSKVGPDKGEGGRGGFALVEYGNTFILESGEIRGFKAEEEGGAVFVSNAGTFYMRGGKITGCSAIGKAGGAVAVHASSNKDIPQGVFEITGGEISGNTAPIGGGVRVRRAEMRIYGGRITGNTATAADGGGGIHADKNNVSLILEIKGSPYILGNTCSNNSAKGKENLYWTNTSDPVQLTGDIDSSAKIGFSKNDNNTNNVLFKANGYSCPLDCFSYDRENYTPIATSDGSIKIRQFTLPKVSGYIIGIGGEILFNVYVDFGSAAQSDVSINYTYSYSKSGGAEKAINKDVTEFNTNGTGTYFVIPVESACMTAPITITLSCEGHDKVYKTTVEDVANASVSINSSYADLVKALLTYGGYAQKQLNINTNKLPVVSGVDFDTAPDYGLTTATYSPASDPDSAFKGGNVSFLSKTEVKFRFLKSALGNGDTAPALTVTYAGGTKTVQGEVSGNYVIYTIKGADEAGFVASRYNESFSFAVGSVSGEYSIYTYLQVINGTGSQPMKNLAQAYYNFAKEAAKIA